MIILFGSTQSYIGLAESKSLLGEYKQIGAVHISHDGEFNKPNAIDPNVIFDANGKLYRSKSKNSRILCHVR